MGSINITSNSNPFTLKDEPIENLRPLKVRVIGAGYAGIYMGIRIPQRLRNIDFQVFEKNDAVGGVWYENRYPGCACDIPAHSYQYSFAPNPHWSGFYSGAAEICEYLQSTAVRFGVDRFVKLQHKVNQCVWNDNEKKWHLTIENLVTGETYEETSDIVIACRGNLNDLSWPNIEGIDTFQGERMHSAAWNDDYDFKNKKIGIIGGGSSSIQIVPKLQAIENTKINCFVRSKVWISNRFGDHFMNTVGNALGLDPTKLDFTEEQRNEFATNSKRYLEFRKALETDGNGVYEANFKDSDMQRLFVEMFSANTKAKLESRPEILASMSPAFGVGCRRLTPGPGYLEALVQENVNFVSDKIASINEAGITMENGKQINIDVLVCATGFNTTAVPPFDIIGKNAETLKDRFIPHPQTYLGVMVDNFPNLFMMLGPNAGLAAGSITVLLESQGDYIVKCIRKLQKEDYTSMSPKSVRVKDFSAYIGEYFKKTVFMDDCKTWYKIDGGLGDRISGLWPGSVLQACEVLRAPRWEDFEYESKEGDGNGLRWLGSGWSTTLLEGGDAAWYLEPDACDVPLEKRPEEDARYKGRPFSH